MDWRLRQAGALGLLPEGPEADSAGGELSSQGAMRQQGGAAGFGSVPAEVVHLILSLLPGRSRARSRLVCKAWNKMIAALPSHLDWCVVLRWNSQQQTYFRAFDPEASQWRELNLPPGPPQELELIASRDGLVALRECSEETIYWVGNPLTGKWQRLGSPPVNPFPQLPDGQRHSGPSSGMSLLWMKIQMWKRGATLAGFELNPEGWSLSHPIATVACRSTVFLLHSTGFFPYDSYGLVGYDVKKDQFNVLVFPTTMLWGERFCADSGLWLVWDQQSKSRNIQFPSIVVALYDKELEGDDRTFISIVDFDPALEVWKPRELQKLDAS